MKHILSIVVLLLMPLTNYTMNNHIPGQEEIALTILKSSWDLRAHLSNLRKYEKNLNLHCCMDSQNYDNALDEIAHNYMKIQASFYTQNSLASTQKEIRDTQIAHLHSKLNSIRESLQLNARVLSQRAKEEQERVESMSKHLEKIGRSLEKPLELLPHSKL